MCFIRIQFSKWWLSCVGIINYIAATTHDNNEAEEEAAADDDRVWIECINTYTNTLSGVSSFDSAECVDGRKTDRQ